MLFFTYSWGDSVTLPIQITNTGKVVAQFRFVPKLDEVRRKSLKGILLESFYCLIIRAYLLLARPV